ncbi:YfhO family protein [Rhizobium sp. 42MFCr.1]|uniref:YfhO family protein n=1 Tax=Rhizobium sp. 42MFCr.1 TaxID=1048680 RepID=UPI00037A9435|nr:YfhO family protein [Rhizobium sp. 42MFCr.1]
MSTPLTIPDRQKHNLPVEFAKAILFYLVFYVGFFSPVLSKGALLAPGDGYIFYYPAISIPWGIWQSNILAGYPTFADPQFFLWYPPRWLFQNYNHFILFAYIAASTLTFGYVRWKTSSTTAGMVSGVIYGSGSFLVGHLGHASIIHSAAWMPLVIWSIDAFPGRASPVKFAIGSVAIALCFLGGHPQIFVYAMVLAGTIAFRNIMQIRTGGLLSIVRLGGAYLGMVAVGIGISAVQLIPFIEFSRYSSRNAWSYGDFISYSLPVRQLVDVFFPYFHGGEGVGAQTYFGLFNQPELAIYAGLGTLFMAGCAVLARRRADGTLFWLGTLLVSVLVASSFDNGLGRLLYHVPVLSSFRAAGRAAMIFTFAASILAALAIARLQGGLITRSNIAVSAVFILVIALIAASGAYSAQWVKQVHEVGLSRWDIVEKGVLPPAAAFVAIVGLFFLSTKFGGRKDRRILSVALVAAVICDVGVFGWFFEWRTATIPSFVDTESKPLLRQTSASNGRVLAMPSVTDLALLPNTNLLYDVRSASGYGPLEPAAYRDATGIDTNGNIPEVPSQAALRVLGITHFAYNSLQSDPISFGSCAGDSADTVLEFTLPAEIQATGIRVTSNMGCSVGLPNGDRILQIDITPQISGHELALTIGRDTSEWAYDRPDVKNVIRHSRASIDSSFAGDGVEGHFYKSVLSFGKRDRVPVRHMSLRFPRGKEGVLKITKFELIDEQTNTSYPINLQAMKVAKDTPVREVSSDLSVVNFDNADRGLAWLVNGVQTLPTLEATTAVRTGKLPDGAPFNPYDIALVDGPAPQLSSAGRTTGEVKLLSDDGSRLTFTVDSSDRGFLFLSQSYHPGWISKVNGDPAQVYRTNGAFQGVVVPKGVSTVTLEFKPLSLKLGALISCLTLIGLGAATLVAFRRSLRVSL